jgi:hypothetical protein
MGKLFEGVTVPGPELIANIILEAVLSASPKAAYSAGPFSEEFLGQRATLDDDAFYHFLAEKTGMMGIQV